MRPLLLLSALLLTAACANPHTRGTPDGPDDLPPEPMASADPRCPAPTDGCMNEDNHAACLEIADTCAGEILQLESCPLQFACADATAPPGSGDPDRSVSNDGAYQPCAGKSCGDECSVCAPGDADCVETAVVKMCDRSGTCSAEAPSCE